LNTIQAEPSEYKPIRKERFLKPYWDQNPGSPAHGQYILVHLVRNGSSSTYLQESLY